MPDFQLLSADAVAPETLHGAFTAAFADYLIGPFTLPAAQWPQFLARHGVELTLSRVAFSGRDIQAFALVAPRPAIGRWRLATMGALPGARGSGAAPTLLDDFTRRAGAARVATVELECFAQNERALRLYRGRGFEPAVSLFGYAGEAGAAPTLAEPIADVTLDAACAWLDDREREIPDLPLQVGSTTLRALPAPPQAWRHGEAQLVAGANPTGTLALHSLVDRDPDQAGARALIAHVMRLFPSRAIHVPQLQREDLGGAALERMGLAKLPLHQVLMRRSL